MTAAFRFNLTILSLIALVVGAYLLFQAFDASVNRRRETWATLRALGQPPAAITRLVLGEAALLGPLGSLLGLGLGWLLAQGSVRAVSQTVNALYGASSARSAGMSVLLVEQNVRAAIEIADRVYVLDDGRTVYSGDAREFAKDEERIRALAGASAVDWDPAPARPAQSYKA